MISKETLEHWKKLCDEATSGPWQHGYSDGSGVMGLHASIDPEHFYITIAGNDAVISCDSFNSNPTDAAFIAESRTAMPQLIEAYEELKHELDAAVEALREVAKGHTIIEFSGKFNSHGYAQTTTKILATPETEKARAVLAIIERGDK